MEARQQMVDRHLRQRVDGAGEDRPVAIERFDQAVVDQLDSEVAAGGARKEPALDGPLDAGARDSGAAEADQLERSKSKRVVVYADESEGQRLHVGGEAVTHCLARDGNRHRHRILDRHPAVDPSHPSIFLKWRSASSPRW